MTSRRDFATVLVALGSNREWMFADEIRGLLKAQLGIDKKTQVVAGWLRRMTLEDMPRFTRRRDSWQRDWQYAVTSYGQTEIQNAMPNLRLWRRALLPSPPTDGPSEGVPVLPHEREDE